MHRSRKRRVRHSRPAARRGRRRRRVALRFPLQFGNWWNRRGPRRRRRTRHRTRGRLSRQSKRQRHQDRHTNLTTPQSISVVTKDQIAAQGAQNIVQALRYTPGVSLDTYGATTFFDAMKLRGFDVPRYLDGLRLPIDQGTQFANPKIETYGLERLEVLRGPSSGLYGQTDPGGLINMISKRPTATPQHEIVGTFGSFDQFQGAFDTSGPIDKNGEFLYRLVGLGR